MASYTWTSATGGDWSLASAWTPDGIPGQAGGDTATIDAAGATFSVTYDQSSESINDLTIDSATATLKFNANDSLTVFGETLLQSGTIDLLSSGSTLDAGGLTMSAGTAINLGGGAALNYYTATLNGCVDVSGTTSFGSTATSIVLNGTIAATAGSASVNFSGITGTGTIEADGATMLVASSLANASVKAVISDSTSSVFETTGTLFYGSSVSIDFLGAHGEFNYDNAASDVNVNFLTAGLNAGASTATPTNFIHLADSVTVTAGGSGTGTAGNVVLSNGDTIALSGIAGSGGAEWVAETVSAAGGGTNVFLAIACFAEGTRIRTPRGDVPVEDLRIGEDVELASGGTAPIRWIGWRHLDLTRHPRARLARPVRIQAGAFAPCVPVRDLRVSPEHAMFHDGVLIPARLLINHATIVEETGCASVTYYHIELDAHGILLAEGAPAESYLDTGNRGIFTNAGTPLVLHPDLSGQAAREARSCAPFADTAGRVKPIWDQMVRRAADLGAIAPDPRVTSDPDIRIEAAGRILRPVVSQDDYHGFVLPDGCDTVRLLSRSSAPADIEPWRGDSRTLGLSVRRITVRDGAMATDIALDHPDLCEGWWDVERHGDTMVRWTNGDAVLPVGKKGMRVLEIMSGQLVAYVTRNEPEAVKTNRIAPSRARAA